MAAPTNSGDRLDMASGEDFTVVNFSPSPPFFSALPSPLQPSPPLYFPSSSNSTVVYPPSPPPRSPSPANLMVVYQGSGQLSMDNTLQNQQHHPLTPATPSISRNKPYAPSPANLMVVYQGSGQLSMDNPLQNQQHHPLTPATPPISRNKPYAGISHRPTTSGESDSATEDVDVMSFLNLSQWSPPRSQSPSDSTVIYQRSGQSSMDKLLRNQHQQQDYVDRPLYVAGYMALLRPWLLQFFVSQSVNLPQNGVEECPGISLLYLYVEDEFFKLYLHGEWWKGLKTYFYSDSLMVPQMEILWMWPFQVENRGHAFLASVNASMGVWRIGPREWVAKIRYQRRSLPMPFFMNDQGRRNVNTEVYFRNKQVILEDARLNFPDLLQIYRKTESIFREKNPNKSYDKEGIIQLYTESLQAKSGVTSDTNSTGVVEEITPLRFSSGARQENPGEDFVNGEVEPVRIGGEIAEPQLNLVPFENRKGETPRGERGKKKTTRVRNVIPLENILQVKKMRLKGAAGNLKVSQSALKRACREYGINRWPPRNKHEGIDKALPSETPTVVDQQGIPQLTSNTVPSDQVLTATVNTNSVIEETALRPFLPTVRQDNPNEDYGNDEVEAVGIGGAGTGEGEMKKNEKAPGVVRGKYKTTGVRIEIALEEILRYREMHIKDAARELKVGRSTLKRICRNYNIHRWPPREEHMLTGQSHPNESPTVVDQESIPQLNSDTLLPSNQITTTSNTNSVTVKAKYKGLRIKFQLFLPWQKVELEQEVKKRLQLDAATYYINYKDEDDEMTLIGCDEDLEGYISSTSHLGTSSIELFLEPK